MNAETDSIINRVPAPLREVFEECVFEILTSQESRANFLESLTDAIADYRQLIELRDSEPAMEDQREVLRKLERSLADALSLTSRLERSPRAAAALDVAAFRQDIDEEEFRASLGRLHGVVKDACRSLAPKEKTRREKSDPDQSKTEKRSARRQLAIRVAVQWHWALKAEGRRSDTDEARANLIEILREVIAFVGEGRLAPQSIERELYDWMRTPTYIAMTASEERREAAEVEARGRTHGLAPVFVATASDSLPLLPE